MSPVYESPQRLAREAQKLRNHADRVQHQDVHLAGRLDFQADEIDELALSVRERPVYGADSEHSFFADRVLVSRGDVRAKERLAHDAAANEKRAITTTTLGGLIPASLPPTLQEQVAFGLRSGAPLATSLLQLPLPDVGMHANWSQVNSGMTIGVQNGENTTVPASGDETVDLKQDSIVTISGSATFSMQASDRSGGWWDMIVAEEATRALATELEAQVWAGSGASGQLKGIANMTGNETSTVSGQTGALTMNQIYAMFASVSTTLGQPPDVCAMASRRYAALGAYAAGFGLDATDLLPDELDTVVSPGAPVTLSTNQDWILVLNRAGVPLVRGEAELTVQREQSDTATLLSARVIIYIYVALGISKRPESVGIVKGLTAPVFT